MSQLTGRKIFSGLIWTAFVAVAACGGSSRGFQQFESPDASNGNENGDASFFAADGSIGTFGDAGNGTKAGDGGSGTGTACPAGLSCNVACSTGTTTVTGKVYDPAGANPLYNVAVYVPATALTPLPKGVPTGANACSCGALYQSGALANTTTGVDGSFTLSNVPVGNSVPLVIQIGKWRRQVNIKVTACEANAQPDKSLAFLGTIPAGDTDDNMPDIAVSTGGCDTLECLMLRVGIPAKEYVAGAGTTGHVHIFSGGSDSFGLSGTGGGEPEQPSMTNAPQSYKSLWDKQADMMPYDVVLLSCECDETYNSNSAVLEQYLNAGGRAFASHFHYAWFAGSAQGENVPAPPSDWGSNLASWFPNLSTSPGGAATVVQTLSGSSKPFPKGVILDQWLKIVNALGVESAPAGQLPIFDENGDVGGVNKAQAWLVDEGYTDYLSFDTPVNAATPADGGAPAYCGRAVFSDIHLNSDSNFASDSPPPPGGCASRPLSPQEKALEFMLFDLSSCVLPDTAEPVVDAGLPPPPQ